MPSRSLGQLSFFDPAFLVPDCLEPGTLPWLLAQHAATLFPPWLATGWRGSGRRGRKAWPARVLLTLLVLRWSEEGMSRLAACKRAIVDVRWRAAMGLRLGAPTPSERTMRDFEAFLRGRHACGTPRYLLLHEHVVRLCLEAGVARGAQWGTDSTPMWCYGAVQDTVRLVGDGLRMIGRRYARATGRILREVARAWDLPLLVAKSVKGHARIDWRDADARADVVHGLAEAALRVAEAVRGTPDLRASRAGREALKLVRTVLKVVEQDLEADEQGRLVIARRVAVNRIVSLTDPGARHGRKTRSVSFEGFKLHVLGDLVGGLVASVCVAPANVSDNVPVHRLVARARQAGVEIDRLLADTAYGAARDRVILRRQHGVEVVAPVPDRPATGRTVRKEEFRIDFRAGSATCPAGITTTERTMVACSEFGVDTVAYHWPKEACAACPMQARCCDGGKGRRRLALHPYEEALRAARAAWTDPALRDEYRDRSRFERLNNELVRHGARQARAWGLGAANLQAHAIAMRCNLALLAKALARAERAAAA
jgi:hypothetical protein